MPCRIHCKICGRISPKSASTFPKQMEWLRKHRKQKHSKAHKKSVKKTQSTKLKKGNPSLQARVMKKARQLLRSKQAKTMSSAMKQAWRIYRGNV